ncbi:MAG: Na+/H+ antiporter NhaA [Phycisphaerae bacterium]|nr:Na+/H+ antiporter NhaA [Phycisphaerae bacterium]
MPSIAPTRIDPPVDPVRDHILGSPDAEMTLVQYGSYADFRCRAVHAVVEGLRNRFGDRMRYVFRHLPVEGKPDAMRAAEITERVSASTGKFWELHEAFMERGPTLTASEIDRIARSHGFGGERGADDPAAVAAARARVRADIESAQRSGAPAAPAFFINGRCYTGTWDESSLADAMLAPLGHRIQAAAFRFVRWGPSSGLLLGLATVLALVLSNSPLGAQFVAFWEKPLGVLWGSATFSHSLLHWVNHGLLSVLFFVVGLEIKREFTVGHLATFRSGALPPFEGPAEAWRIHRIPAPHSRRACRPPGGGDHHSERRDSSGPSAAHRSRLRPPDRYQCEDPAPRAAADLTGRMDPSADL